MSSYSYNDHHYRSERDHSSNSHYDRYDAPNNNDEYSSRRPGELRYDRRSEIPCRFGMNCRNNTCPYLHSPPFVPVSRSSSSSSGLLRWDGNTDNNASMDRRASVTCRYGMNCTRAHCPYKHESETNNQSTNNNALANNYNNSSLAADSAAAEVAEDQTKNGMGKRVVPPMREQPSADQSLSHQFNSQSSENVAEKRFELQSNHHQSKLLQSNNREVEEVQQCVKSNDTIFASQSSSIPSNKSEESLVDKECIAPNLKRPRLQETDDTLALPKATPQIETNTNNAPKKDRSQSTSTLANLLSSQRRSAAQLHRYRVQQARPFEKLQSDVPIMSTTTPKIYPAVEKSVQRSNVNTKREDLINRLNQNGLIANKSQERLSDDIAEEKEIKEPAAVTLNTKSEKISTKTETKKRKADKIESMNAIIESETVVVKKGMKSKGVNPFRVKVGTVVAIRYRNLSEGGNPSVVQLPTNKQSRLSAKGKPKLFEVWAEPIAGRDDGVALLGSRIKCVFTKSFVENWRKKNASIFNPDSTIQYRVEGNVVSVLGNDDQLGSSISVGLLVDREKIKFMPYLHVISDDKTNETLSSSKRIEDKIRGEKKVIVKVDLASVMDKRKGLKLHRSVVKQWVVRKRVLAKPSGKKPAKSERKVNSIKKQSLFVGDGNDTSQQQEKNWRWVASHTHTAAVDSTNEANSSDFVSQLVGEVTDMVVHNDTGNEGSLATVTIQRLWTPEQTNNGRTGVHGHLELFDNYGDKIYFQAPVEDLIVIGKSVSRKDIQDIPNNENGERNFRITHSYKASDGTYSSLSGGACDCCFCDNINNAEVAKDLYPLARTDHDSRYTVDESISTLVTSIMKSTRPTNFAIPIHVGLTSMRPSFIPNTGSKSRLYSGTKSAGENKKSPKRPKKEKRKRLKTIHEKHDSGDEKEDTVKFKPTCSRTIPFDDITSDYWYLRYKKGTSCAHREPSTREFARPRAVNSKTNEANSLLTGRAARANQRRVVKSMGSASTNIDRLAGRDREQYLRFGKSTIEGWGVFAEVPISAGHLIIEYRGELIGHAVADKREREYEANNVPDYMFRIDAFTVCDATRLGNVARFINASCSPNCYTQIIKENENKRIVIYAKQDIERGKELCYDYKFQIEMDPAKRIPCGCGSIECRGYMNWDKRWD